MAEKMIRMTTAVFYKFMSLVVLGLMITSCNPIATAIENNPAVRHTEEITLEPSVETEIVSAIPENTPTVTATATPTPEATPAQEFTPTNTTTPTLEATPTPEAITFPSDLVIHEDLRFNREYPMTDYGQGYKTKQWDIIIREQDLHLDEPFTLGGGRYHVQAWADAWFMDKEGKGYHLSIPLVIFDTEKLQRFGYFNLIWKSTSGIEEAEEKILELYTGPFSENFYVTNIMEAHWCFTETQFRNCGEADLNPIFMEKGYIPSTDIDMSSHKWDGIRHYIDFHRELLGDVYTQENLEAFWQDPDLNPRSLQLPDPNLPANFFVPLALHLGTTPFQ